MKLFCQQQCTNIIQIKKENSNSILKIFPTIDISNPYILKSWSILRRVLFDYGKSFDSRLQVFFKINMIIFIITAAITVLWFYGLYDFPQEYIVVSIYEIVVQIIILSLILLKGALINAQFEDNKNILGNFIQSKQYKIGEHRVLALNLLRLKKPYFKDNLIPNNLILRRMVMKIKQEIDTENSNQPMEEQAQNIIEGLLNSVQDCETELSQDEINRPFTFFNLKITLALLQTLGAGLATFIYASIQYKYLSE